MRRIRAGLALMLIAPLAIAGKPAVFSTDAGAISGYDPVAYFTNGVPTRGSAQFTSDWQGATYHFASAGNLAAFKEQPAAFAPQFGGYCAYAVSKGYTASSEPEAWRIVDGKLYLNYSLSVRQRWDQDAPANIRLATDNWPSVLDR